MASSLVNSYKSWRWRATAAPRWLFAQVVGREERGSRKLRLAAVALARTVWDELTNIQRLFFGPNGHLTEAVDIAEAFADRIVDATVLMQANEQCYRTLRECQSLGYSSAFYAKMSRVLHVAYWATSPEIENLSEFPIPDAIQCAVLRDVFRNPFNERIDISPFRTSAAVQLAGAIYQSRDSFLLSVLADCLEESGCDLPEIIDHCRRAAPHYKGCWLIDELLGEEA